MWYVSGLVLGSIISYMVGGLKNPVAIEQVIFGLFRDITQAENKCSSDDFLATVWGKNYSKNLLR
jgi:hypothetical protein